LCWLLNVFSFRRCRGFFSFQICFHGSSAERTSHDRRLRDGRRLSRHEPKLNPPLKSRSIGRRDIAAVRCQLVTVLRQFRRA